MRRIRFQFFALADGLTKTVLNRIKTGEFIWMSWVLGWRTPRDPFRRNRPPSRQTVRRLYDANKKWWRHSQFTISNAVSCAYQLGRPSSCVMDLWGTDTQTVDLLLQNVFAFLKKRNSQQTILTIGVENTQDRLRCLTWRQSQTIHLVCDK